RCRRVRVGGHLCLPRPVGRPIVGGVTAGRMMTGSDRSRPGPARYARPMSEPHGGEVAPRTRDQLWRLLFFTAAALLLVGLGFDRWGNGDGTGSEPAHSIVIVGGTVTILAAVILLLSPVFERRAARGGVWRVLQVAVPVLAVGVLGPAMVAAASASTSNNN